MKPVVSSFVALALAIAPLSALAKPVTHGSKSSHAKVVKHDKAEKGEKIEKIADKSEKSEKSSVVRVKAGKKDGVAIKKVVHHAQDVDLGGGGHKEPKVDSGVLVAASMKVPSTTSGTKAHAVKGAPTKSSDMPQLPNAGAGKPSKGGAEKGARKPAEKKTESSDDSGEPTRDEESAELVARSPGKGKSPSAHPCTREPVEIVRGPEVERFELTKCDGSLAPLAVERLSILVRPGGVARPTTPVAELAKKSGHEVAPGIRRVDPRLVDRIQAVIDRFGTSGAPAKIAIISGYRPASVGSMHSSGRAIDFRVEGVRNEDVVTFCKTLGDTGCGFYPNSSFVHIDVRDAGAGQVSWIDASGPGETPRYVPVWPPPTAAAAERYLHRASATQPMEALAEEGARLLRARRPTEHGDLGDSADERPAVPESDE